MIKSFFVKNFKAFKETVGIDFSATGNYEFSKDALKENIVKTAIMYGKNASGKSSISLALFDIVYNISDNYVPLRDYLSYQNAFNSKLPVDFCYSFLLEGKNVIYKYTKTNLTTFISEELIIDGRTVISYNKHKSSSTFDVLLSGTENLIKNLSHLNISALKWVKNNSVLTSNDENACFLKLFDFVNKMLLFWSLDARDFIGYEQTVTPNIVDAIIKRKNFENLKNFFKMAGCEDEIIHNTSSGQEELYISYNGVFLPFNIAASTGMKSLLLVYYWLENFECDNCPSFIVIDEFDAFYHYELSRFIVDKLKSLNVQVLLTTHNTSLISNDILRPDCYFICSKDKIVSAHNATEKEIRYGNNLEKLYRGGTFGKCSYLLSKANVKSIES